MSKTIKLTFDAPPHHVLSIDGKDYRGGDEFSVSEARAMEIIAGNQIPVRVDLEGITRDALDKIAARCGLSTEELGSKAEVIETINRAGLRLADHLPSGGPEPIHADLDEGRERQTQVQDHAPSEVAEDDESDEED